MDRPAVIAVVFFASYDVGRGKDIGPETVQIENHLSNIASLSFIILLMPPRRDAERIRAFAERVSWSIKEMTRLRMQDLTSDTYSLFTVPEKVKCFWVHMMAGRSTVL